jgi:pre-mRNA-splicing factor CWC22
LQSRHYVYVPKTHLLHLYSNQSCRREDSRGEKPRRGRDSRSRSPSTSSKSRSRDSRDSRDDRRRSRRDSRSRSRSQSRERGDDRRSSGRRRGEDLRYAQQRENQNNSQQRNNNNRKQNQPAAEPALPRERKPLSTGRAGGAYIPPFKLAQLMAEVEDKESAAYQRMTWDALRKSINGLVNKINTANIKHILPEVFSENLVRGRGLLCRSLMKSQMASPGFSPVYAALVAVINTKFPEIGELLLHRVVTQFKRSFKRNDKPVCLAALTFIAHLINQQVVHEVLALEIALLLLETPSDDGVEVCSEFMKQCGAMLQDLSPAGLTFVFDRLRAILHEGIGVSTRTQYIIEGLYAVRKAGFEISGHPAVPPELDLVETSDQITHEISLEDALDPQMALDVFKEDPEFTLHEQEYAAIRREILGDDEDEEIESGQGDESSDEEDETDEEGGGTTAGPSGGNNNGAIQDHTGTDLVNLRRTIYLTIMSALDFEEAGHKLLKMGIPNGLEHELATMIIECCSQEKTFIRYYALLAERFCKLKAAYADSFADCFVAQYRLIHRLETNKLRNVAKLFDHLLATDGLPWAVLSVIRLTEDDTTSSSRIFIKTLFQELAETMGLRSLNARLEDPACEQWFEGIFPQDTPRNMRFSINFFTSIGLGGLTDRMREVLKNLPKLIAAQQAAAAAAAAAEAEAKKKTRNKKKRSSSSSSSSDSDTDSDSDTSSTSSSGSDSDSSTSSGSSGSSDSDSSGSDSDDSRDSRGRGGGGSNRGRKRSRERRRRSPSSSRSRSRSRSKSPGGEDEPKDGRKRRSPSASRSPSPRRQRSRR